MPYNNSTLQVPIQSHDKRQSQHKMAGSVECQDSKRTVDVGAFLEKIRKQCASNGFQNDSSTSTRINDLFTRYDATVRDTGITNQQIQNIRDELVARIRGQTIRDRPLNTMPSEAELEALQAEEAELFRPFSEDVITVLSNKEDGAGGTKQFTLAKCMQAHKQKTEAKGAQLELINVEIEKINAEIDAIAHELENGLDPSVKRAKARLDAELKRITKAEQEAAEWYETEMAGQRKEQDREAPLAAEAHARGCSSR
ncbi:hypothetical protein EJ03DRAFT_39832 [Teratosphaeria nubilosa]|uniref:Uncharacterized protein n=1 Tax=Teratosphaeria nubilosa TaxID=161662 RepID=A0A6G1LFK7_9PEZI|nr:hypothetical protein EJ03DRAFT_39832 [Teratosphaeria nubilosa]